MTQNSASIPPQTQSQMPGREHEMAPKPCFRNPSRQASGKLANKVAVITGGDSGIGRAVSCLFAEEGAQVVVSYLNEHKDAETTRDEIEKIGGECHLVSGDIAKESTCKDVISEAQQRFGRVDVLVNNAAHQIKDESDLSNIDETFLTNIFSTNVFSMFYLIRESLKHMQPGSSIINTSSVVAFKGSGRLPTYSSTKGAILALTRALVSPLLENGIRINAVAPGPIWTPLIPASFSEEEVESFGTQSQMNRAGQPSEVAPSYVFLASEDASYITGQVIHPNGGIVVGA